MKKITAPLLVLMLAITAAAFSAETPDYQAVLRTKKGGWKIASVELAKFAGLKDPWILESPDFKIVEKKGSTPIDLRTADPDLALRATNVLYHLTIAKNYFLNALHLDSLRSQPQLTIRLEITNSFSNLGHFKNDHLPPEYNNALSIAGGTAIGGSGIAPWGNEIWFRPKKEIPIQEILKHLPEDPMNPTIRGIRSIFYPMEGDLAIRNTLYALFYSTAPLDSWLSEMTREAGTIVLVEGALQLSKIVNRAVIPHSYFIDTSMIPEVIYHEYSHQAMADYINVDAWTPVVEGFADYFAAVISGSPDLAAKIARFNTARHKEGQKTRIFELKNEIQPTSDFVLSLMWGLRKVFGNDFTNGLMLDTRKEINAPTADIRNGLTSALAHSCDRLSKDPEYDRERLLQYLTSRGL